MAKFKINIVTYSKKLLEKEVEFLKVRTVLGDMGILANHSPLVVELQAGEMKLKYDGVEEYYFLWRFSRLLNNMVNIIKPIKHPCL